jgi:hypothetical protein
MWFVPLRLVCLERRRHDGRVVNMQVVDGVGLDDVAGDVSVHLVA